MNAAATLRRTLVRLSWSSAVVLVASTGIASAQPPVELPVVVPPVAGAPEAIVTVPTPPPTPIPPPAQLPGLPPAVGFGGYPSAPPPLRDANTFPELSSLLHDNLTIRLRGKGTLRPYGLLRGDLDFATNKFNDIQNPFFVLPADPSFLNGTGNVPAKTYDPNYSLYPRLSRLGLEYYSKPIADLGGLTPSGRFEADFLVPNTSVAGFNTESREFVRLRLAYAQLQRGEFTLVVGQDWDIIAPLIPTIDDNTLLWNAGNMGDRRPIVKLLWDHDFGAGMRLQVQNGIALGDAIDNLDLDQNGFRDQEDSGLPTYQGRVGLVLPSIWGANQPVIAGVWGLLTQDSTNKPVGTSGRTHFYGRAIGGDLRVPITDRLAFQAEAFYGRNLDDFRGGIGQGINSKTGETIETKGGWLELIYRPFTHYQVSVGGSADDPVNSDIPVGGRTANYVWYVGNRFPLGDGIVVGADYEHWTTEYSGFRAGRASRVKLFLSLAF